MNMKKLILPAGVQTLGIAEPAGSAELFKLKLGSARRLSDLESEWAFYTPALLYLTFVDAPDLWAEFIKTRLGPEPKMTSTRFDKQIFEGLSVYGDDEWNYVLFAVEREHVLAWSQFIGGSAIMSPDKGVWKLGWQTIAVPDPLASQPRPMVRVGAITVRDNSQAREFRHLDSRSSARERLYPRPFLLPNTDRSVDRLHAAVVAGNSPYALSELEKEELTRSLAEDYPQTPLHVEPEVSIEQVPAEKHGEILAAVDTARNLGIVS